MTPIEFAKAHFESFQEKGAEIIPKYCPYCGGGDHRDKYSAAMNIETGAFNCKRGSCGKEVSFKQLCEDFGETPDRRDSEPAAYTRPKAYKKPKAEVKPLATAAEKYLELRKISKATMEAYRIGCDDMGNIIFPFYENGEVVYVKYRPARKLQKGELKAWQDPGTKPVLFGMDLCDPKFPLVIYEGEADCMSGHEAGIPNSVSVPSGCENMTWIDTCWDFLQRFEKIYLFGDNDAAGLKMIETLSRRLSEFRIFVVEHECKDANELLYRKGPEAVKAAYDQAKELPAYGVIRLADVTPLDLSREEKTLSGISEFDKKIMGFMGGELSVWTGKRGEGKSTFLGQLLLEAVEQKRPVCAYSGELRAEVFQKWIHLQAAGPNHLQSRVDTDSGKAFYFPDSSIVRLLKAWYGPYFWLYDNKIAGANEVGNIIKVFEYCAKRFGCKIFMVDNLMTCRYSTSSDRDFYRMQSSIVGELVEFAKRMDVHVHLVAHPRKTDGNIDSDDISGSGDIANRADNVFVLKKADDKGKEKLNCDSGLSIQKNRSYGANGVIGLNFCTASRRLYLPSVGNVRKYGWEKALEAPQGFTEVEYATPFDDPMAALDMPF